jgi:hypothetical protein
MINTETRRSRRGFLGSNKNNPPCPPCLRVRQSSVTSLVSVT